MARLSNFIHETKFLGVIRALRYVKVTRYEKRNILQKKKKKEIEDIFKRFIIIAIFIIFINQRIIVSQSSLVIIKSVNHESFNQAPSYPSIKHLSITMRSSGLVSRVVYLLFGKIVQSLGGHPLRLKVCLTA